MNPEGLLVQNIETTHDYGFKLTEDINQEFKKRMANMIDFYKSSEDYKMIKPTLHGHLDFDTKMNTVSWFKQFYKVLERGFINEIRNPMGIRMQFVQTIFFACINIIVFEGVY